MCDTCAGIVILKTADGIEFEQKVADCDIDHFVRPLMPKNVFGTYKDFSFTQAEVVGKREYHFNGEHTRAGIRILEEVVDTIKVNKSGRSTEVLEKISVLFNENA